MVDNPKYKITAFSGLSSLSAFQSNAELRFAAHTAALYYEFAFYQMMDFCTVTNEMFKENPPEGSLEYDAYLYRAWSHAYAMYALLRTSLDAVRNVNRNFSVDVSIYEQRVKEIIDTANDIVKHPMFNGDGSYAHLPLSLWITNDIEVQKWTDKDSPSSQVTLSPAKDFHTVGNYLEHIASAISPV